MEDHNAGVQSQNMTIQSGKPELTNKDSRLVGVSSAGIRAIMYQLTSLYLRTPPAKLFRPTRVDYMAVTRLYVHGSLKDQKNRPWSLYKNSSLATLITAIKKFGWRFIPESVLPPLIANSATGIVLYTSYLMSLQYFNDDKKNFLQNPSPFDTLRAGFVAGTFQSLAAAPIDAIYARSTANEILKGKHNNLWVFGLAKLKEIGVSGVFAGYGLSFLKESIGFAIYFCAFETIKNQIFSNTKNSFITYKYYRDSLLNGNELSRDDYQLEYEKIHKFRLLKTSYTFMAGIFASFTLHFIQYPINKIQNILFSRLEALDVFNHKDMKSGKSSKIFTVYYNSYMNTLDYILYMKSSSSLSWYEWLYKGFKTHALSTIPSTTIGLLTLEVLRNRLASEADDFFTDERFE
ncbi:hypothetical protein WICMUC_005671 [Wickerhamomyces mucosus]|uniref:Mitochondrial carrier protein n=1 Tax=Wickerhamomyces mucosus TaxID=1378264 RepID=A0A9P8P6G5_9ASCO|nr:hypothetical protein WICMUC_005671 [Wickerhamomyces mucosus]